MSATVDSTRLFRAIEMKRQIPRQYGPEIVNKSTLQVAIGSGSGRGLVQLTQKATVRRIENDMRQNKLGLKLAAAWLKKQGAPMTKAAVADAYNRILAARIKSRAYIAAGWLYSALHLAAKVPGHGLKRLRPAGIEGYAQGTAAESFSRFAVPGRLFAGVYNTSRGAGSVCPDGLVQQAVNNEARNVEQFIERKMGAAISDAVNGTNTARRVA